MTERYRRSSGVGETYTIPAKMENEFTPKKTMIIMVIVVACFAVLWPKIFYPMLVGSANQQIKPSAIDKTTGTIIRKCLYFHPYITLHQTKLEISGNY